jgi:hypothetical protein
METRNSQFLPALSGDQRAVMQGQGNTKCGTAYAAADATSSSTSAFVALDNSLGNSESQSRSMIFLGGKRTVQRSSGGSGRIRQGLRGWHPGMPVAGAGPQGWCAISP